MYCLSRGAVVRKASEASTTTGHISKPVQCGPDSKLNSMLNSNNRNRVTIGIDFRVGNNSVIPMVSLIIS